MSTRPDFYTLRLRNQPARWRSLTGNNKQVLDLIYDLRRKRMLLNLLVPYVGN